MPVYVVIQQYMPISERTLFDGNRVLNIQPCGIYKLNDCELNLFYLFGRYMLMFLNKIKFDCYIIYRYTLPCSFRRGHFLTEFEI